MSKQIAKILFILTMIWPIQCEGQQTSEDLKVTNVTGTYFPAATIAQEKIFVDVTFSLRLDFGQAENFQPSNITVTALPATTLVAKPAEPRAGSRRQVHIPFSGSIPDSATQIQVCFKKLEYFPSGQSHAVTANDVCGTGIIVNVKNVVAQKNRLLEDMKKVPKTSSEKNIFASGFVTTTSDGSEGGADINLNSPDLGIPGLTTFAHLKKTSTDKGDPKNFEAGFGYKSTFLYKSKDYDAIAEKLNQYHTAADDSARAAALTDINQRLSSLQGRFLAATFIDFAGRLEGQLSNFNVTNFVGEGAIQLQSRTLTLFGSRNGFWRFRILPAGVEGGSNLGQGDLKAATPPGGTTPDVHWIARFKSGAQFTTFYHNDETTLPVKRLDLDLQVVNRYLFFQEVTFDQTTKKSSTVSKGDKLYFQVDLKVYLVESPSGRYGFKLSYNRGSLPPVYSRVASFQFGFVYETADGETPKSVQGSGKKP